MPLELPGKSDEIQSQESNLSTHDELWYSMLTECMRILAYQNNKLNHYITVRQQVVLSKDVATTVDLIEQAHTLATVGNQKGIQRINTIIAALRDYIVNVRVAEIQGVETFDQYLAFTGFEVSQLMADILNGVSSPGVSGNDDIVIVPNNTNEQFPDGITVTSGTDQTNTDDNPLVTEANIFDEGFWELDYTMGTPDTECVPYHFVLQVSDQEDYSNLVLTADTRVSTDNWNVEIKEDVFAPLSDYIGTNGLGDNFANNTIRYSSGVSDYLNRGTIYYFRVFQVSENDTFGPTEFEDIIYT